MSTLRHLAALLLVGGLVACGNDEAAEPGDWKAEVSAICKASSARVTKLAEEVGADVDDRQAATAEVLERSVSIVEEQLDELRDVEVPEGLRGDYAAFLDRIGESLPLFEQLARAVRTGAQPDPGLRSEFARIGADTRPFATEHGLTACLADAS